MSLGATVTMMLIEDDPVDIESIRRSFRKKLIANEIVIANDGIDGLEMLRTMDTDKPKMRCPLIILLDINMPRMNGLEFLRELRAGPKLHDLVAIVLTTSDSQTDIYAADDLNVAAYILMQESAEGFLDVVNLLDTYWEFVELKS